MRFVNKYGGSMRVLFLIVALAFSCSAQAGCEDIADLRTSEMFINISDGGCAGETMIFFSTQMDRNGEIAEDSLLQVPFYEECTLLWNGKKSTKDGTYADGGFNGFSCHAKGRTPLAGATYKLIKYGKSRNACDDGSEPGNRYICVKGCDKPPVPKYLNGSDGSC